MIYISVSRNVKQIMTNTAAAYDHKLAPPSSYLHRYLPLSILLMSPISFCNGYRSTSDLTNIIMQNCDHKSRNISMRSTHIYTQIIF